MARNGDGGSGDGGHFVAPGGARTDAYPDVDLPATGDEGQDFSQGQDVRYIDEAFDHMVADDMPQDAGQPPPQPQYPEPVQPQVRAPQTRQPQARAPQAQARAPQAQPRAPAPAPAPEALTPEAQAQAAARQRAERDPFGVQADVLEEQQQAYVDQLAQQIYPINDKDMDAFLSGDGSRVSQALARVHVNAVGSVMRVISQQMPIWVGHMLKYHQSAVDREGSFWAANPGLNRTEHKALADAAARAYMGQFRGRAAPDAAEVNRIVGAMVAAAVGIDPGASQPVHRTAQGVRTPGRVVRAAPSAFTPAGTQGTRAPAQRDDNPWAQMSDIIQADDAGLFDTR